MDQIFKTLFMVILGNFKNNYDTGTKTAHKPMGFDIKATQSC